MSLHLFTAAATLYILGFFMPFIFQILMEKYYIQNKNYCLNLFKKYKFTSKVLMFFRRKNLNKSLANSCFFMGIISIVLANVAMLGFSPTVQNQLYSLFIGLWAPTMIVIGIYLKKK
jgi:hypothetical protein